MATVQVEQLRFTFKSSVAAQKYDDWVHHRKVLQINGMAAVDVVAMRMGHQPAELWLIEAKDFRQLTQPPLPSNLKNLPATVLKKVEDTISGLRHAFEHAAENTERGHARRALRARQTRVVLHLEPYAGAPSKLFPANFSSAAIRDKLRQLVSHIDRKPLVLNIANTARSGVPWTVTPL